MHASYHYLLTLITDIGDSAVLLAIVITAMFYLLSRRCYKAAFTIAFSFVAACIFITVLKMFFLGCRADITDSDIHSPSGHAALSSAVFGTLALILGTQLHGLKRRVMAILLITLAILIAFSRVPLGAHSASEVFIGLLVGSLAVYLSHLILRSKPTPPFDVHVLALWLVVVGVLFHGIRLPAEALIRMLAHDLKAHTPVCRLFD